MAQQVLSQHATTRARDDPSSTAVHGVLAVVGYNRRRAVALEFEVDRIDDSRHANVVVVRVFFCLVCVCVWLWLLYLVDGGVVYRCHRRCTRALNGAFDCM